MTDLANFVLSMYPADSAVGDSIKIAQDLEGLSLDELMVLAGVDEPTPLEKRAFDMCGDDNRSWLDQFDGTPLAHAAIALCEQELEQRAKHLQKRIERQRNDDHQDEWTERDQLSLQKRRLELALHKHKVGAQGAPTLAKPTAPKPAPTAPAPLAGTPQTASMPKLSSSERRKDHFDSRAGNAARGAAGAGATGAVVGGAAGATIGHQARKLISFVTKSRLSTPGGRRGIREGLQDVTPSLRKKVLKTLRSKWKLPAAGAAILGTVGGVASMPAGAVGGASARIKKSAFEIMKLALVPGSILKMTSILGKGGRAARGAARGAAGMEARAGRMAAAGPRGAVKRIAARPPPTPAMTAGGKPMIRKLQSGAMSAGGQAARQTRLKTLQSVERVAAR